jgi:hypothetical protein
VTAYPNDYSFLFVHQYADGTLDESDSGEDCSGVDVYHAAFRLVEKLVERAKRTDGLGVFYSYAGPVVALGLRPIRKIGGGPATFLQDGGKHGDEVVWLPVTSEERTADDSCDCYCSCSDEWVADHACKLDLRWTA